MFIYLLSYDGIRVVVIHGGGRVCKMTTINHMGKLEGSEFTDKPLGYYYFNI